jgi:hypothetical protein
MKTANYAGKWPGFPPFVKHPVQDRPVQDRASPHSPRKAWAIADFAGLNRLA